MQSANPTDIAKARGAVPSLILADEDIHNSLTPEAILYKADGGYQWFKPSNRQRALECVMAMLLAYHYRLEAQVSLHKGELPAILAKDRADFAEHQATEMRTFHGRFEYAGGPTRSRFPLHQAFSSEGMKPWLVSEVNAFSQRIPLAALKTMDLLYAKGVIPDRVWVAEEKPMPRALITRPDPYLIFSFGGYFVAVARWI